MTVKTSVALSLNRRLAWVAAGGLLLLGAALFPGLALSQNSRGPAEVPVVELMKTPHLPDLAYGSEDAPVTIVEYASMTCGHCRAFHQTVLPELKKKYIDAGKVRLIFREFPLDARAYAASMLARCGAEGKQLALVDALFQRQEAWAYVKSNPQPKLYDIVKQAGFTEEKFNKCLTDDKLLEKLTARYTRASEAFGVRSTPTFFINGKRHQSSPVFAEFEKAIDPLLAAPEGK